MTKVSLRDTGDADRYGRTSSDAEVHRGMSQDAERCHETLSEGAGHRLIE